MSFSGEKNKSSPDATVGEATSPVARISTVIERRKQLHGKV